MNLIDWIEPLSAGLGILVGLLLHKVISWRNALATDEKQAGLRKAETRVEEVLESLAAREAALERENNELLERSKILEERESSISPKIEEINEWWTKARSWETGLAKREALIDGREAAAKAQAEKARAALKGARARAKRLLSQHPRQPGR